jgi:hypothetical protein
MPASHGAVDGDVIGGLHRVGGIDLPVEETPYRLFKRDVSIYAVKRLLSQQTTKTARNKCLEKIIVLKQNRKCSFTARCEVYAATNWDIPAMAKEDRDVCDVAPRM